MKDFAAAFLTCDTENTRTLTDSIMVRCLADAAAVLSWIFCESLIMKLLADGMLANLLTRLLVHSRKVGASPFVASHCQIELYDVLDQETACYWHLFSAFNNMIRITFPCGITSFAPSSVNLLERYVAAPQKIG